MKDNDRKSLLNRIESNSEIMLGKPVIKGTRVTVELILRKLSEDIEVDDLFKAYPHLTKDDLQAALFYASEVISGEELIVPEDTR